ncbi:MAG: UDP-glucuronate 4-epimerase [Myxococcota bacterium]
MAAILVTGTAGFIGYHLAERLLADGRQVVGLDIVNDYYDVALKEARLARLASHGGYSHERIDLADRGAMERLFRTLAPERVVNLAAQAGVRHSLDRPHDYVDSNLVGFLNILEGCRYNGCGHLIYASSSSVYGSNRQMPFTEDQPTEHPLSIYAATKKANELMAHSYSSLYRLPVSGLRFFTVYGPWGRPDMALFLFTEAILAGKPIRVFNHGDMSRDFTYVADVVEGIVRLIDHVPTPAADFDPHQPSAAVSDCPYRVYNIGNNAPVGLMDMITTLERCLGREADKTFLPMQPGDVKATWADAGRLVDAVAYQPATALEEGVQAFVDWYLEYYQRTL